VNVARVKFGDQIGADPGASSKAIADHVLQQPMSADITSGAIKWFSPKRSRNKKPGQDTRGGQIEVKNDKGKTVKVWAPRFHLDMTYVQPPGTSEWLARFYAL